MKNRKLLKITSRSSSITNSFVQAIIPSIEPTAAEVEEALAVLSMKLSHISCIYCGGRCSDWDHLRPLVRNKQPTGYINEIRNLVPSCGLCNQSKGGMDWRVWMEGTASGSPRSRGVVDVEERMARLDAYEKWGGLSPLPLGEMAGVGEWKLHWDYLGQIHELMREAQQHAEIVRESIRKSFGLIQKRSFH